MTKLDRATVGTMYQELLNDFGMEEMIKTVIWKRFSLNAYLQDISMEQRGKSWEQSFGDLASKEN